MNEGGDSRRGEVDGEEPRDRESDELPAANAESDLSDDDARDVDDERLAGGALDGDGRAESWSAAAPTAGDDEIPLPWTVGESEAPEEEVPEAFEDFRFVGPKSAAALRDSDVSVEDLARKRVTYRDLTERGVHPGVAAKIRREHSLSWSHDANDADLSRRSSQVRGLDDGERAWIADSAGWSDDGETGEAETADGEAAWRRAATETDDGSETRDEEAAWRERTSDAGDDDPTQIDRGGEAAWREQSRSDSNRETLGADAEARWREQSAPTPVTALDAVDDEYASRLADAGIRSVRRLATADPESVADALELDRRRVERWCEAATDHLR